MNISYEKTFGSLYYILGYLDLQYMVFNMLNEKDKLDKIRNYLYYIVANKV